MNIIDTTIGTTASAPMVRDMRWRGFIPHPLCLQFRRMTAEEADNLRTSIATAGFDREHKIKLWRPDHESVEQILEGYSRYERTIELLDLIERCREELPRQDDPVVAAMFGIEWQSQAQHW